MSRRLSVSSLHSQKQKEAPTLRIVASSPQLNYQCPLCILLFNIALLECDFQALLAWWHDKLTCLCTYKYGRGYLAEWNEKGLLLLHLA